MKSGINQLDSSDIEKITDVCEEVAVNEGEDLILKGDRSRDLYIVKSGSFKVYDDTLDEKFVHAILDKGSIFGEMSFIDGVKRSASVQALENGVLLRMGKDEFNDLLAKAPDTAMLLIFTLARVVTRRLRDVNIALRNMSVSERDMDSALRDLINQMRQAVHIELDGE